MLWAFDSLYVVVNASGKYQSGLYRVTDTNGDDALDKVEQLRKLEGAGEHGPHAVVLAPDGKSLYVVGGNATKVPALSGSLVPRVWGEDNLRPRMVDGRGFMTTEKAPGGYVCRVDPEGKDWVLESMGYRNAFDMAFNRDGDLFTFDSDMEWDMNTPWYRPTRVCMVEPGADYGYRNGAGKWPTYYFDSLPPVANIGPGSPTGVAFGYGAKFPAKYQDALFLCDWSYGKLFAAHIKADGSSYTADFEEFITGTPLPLTDLVINPKDGAMYFAIGGRKTTSGLYRVTYVGDEPTAPSTAKLAGAEARELRRSLEAFHGHADPKAVDASWPFLSNSDRFLRYAARVAIEFQDPSTWRDRALAETHPQAARSPARPDPGERCSPTPPAPGSRAEPGPRRPRGSRGKILAALGRLDWDIDRAELDKLPYARKLDLARIYEVVFNRLGPPEDATADRLASRFDAVYPGKGRELNVELCNLLVYLNSPTVAAKTVPMLETAPTQEEQMEYGRALRVLKQGWTPELRRAYFSWLARTPDFKGGPSLEGFLRQISDAALATVTDSEKADLRPILDAPRQPRSTASAPTGPARSFVKAWTVDELVPVGGRGPEEEAATSTRAARSSPPRLASPAIDTTTKGPPSAPTSPASPAGSAPAT